MWLGRGRQGENSPGHQDECWGGGTGDLRESGGKHVQRSGQPPQSRRDVGGAGQQGLSGGQPTCCPPLRGGDVS